MFAWRLRSGDNRVEVEESKVTTTEQSVLTSSRVTIRPAYDCQGCRRARPEYYDSTRNQWVNHPSGVVYGLPKAVHVHVLELGSIISSVPAS